MILKISKGFVLYLFIVTIEILNMFIFALKLHFYQLKIVDLNIFCFQIIFEILYFALKLCNNFILLYIHSFNDFFFALL
jgi:hypothetical protein